MCNLQGDRFRYTFTLGCEDNSNNGKMNVFVGKLVERLSKMTGGMKVKHHTGIWRRDGNTQRPYTGEMVDEPSVSISFVSEIEPDEMIPYAKRVFRKVREDVAFECSFMQWVNVEYERVSVHHFDMTKE